jgi:hypothetical protein
MKIRAISVASSRSNLVGTLEIDCSHLGLALTYIDALLVTGEGAPVPIDPGQRVSLHWSHVRDARVLGDAVAFEIDPAPLPPQKLLLVRFSPGRDSSPHRIYQIRIAMRLAFLAASIVSAIALAIALGHVGWRAAIAGGAGAGLALVAAGLGLDALVGSGGTRSRVVRELFVGELLAFVPNLPREPVGVSMKSVRWPRIEAIVPRTTVSVAASLAAVSIFALAMPGSIAGPSVAPDAAPSAGSAEPKAPPAKSLPVARMVGPCDCTADDDPLRGQPLPRVSLIVLGSRGYKRSGKNQTEVDLAVVNNGNRELFDLTSIVEFFEQADGPLSTPAVVSRRPVYHAGPIGPGEAIKWRVDAEGSTFKIRPLARMGAPITGTIGTDAVGAASSTAIAGLLKANNHAVRLHGAMLLAFFGEPRLKDVIADLEKSLGAPASAYLGRLAEATGDLRTCRVLVAGQGARRRVSACIANNTGVERTGVEMTLRALDRAPALRDPAAEPPEVLTERTLAIAGAVAGASGVAVEADFDLASGQAPAAFEAVARSHTPE